MAKKCIGCGVELQGEDKNKRGYLPQSVLDKEGENFIVRDVLK